MIARQVKFLPKISDQVNGTATKGHQRSLKREYDVLTKRLEDFLFSKRSNLDVKKIEAVEVRKLLNAI